MQRMGPSVVEFKEVHSSFYLWSLYLKSGQMAEQFHSLPKYKDETLTNRLLDYSYRLFCWQFRLLF